MTATLVVFVAIAGGHVSSAKGAAKPSSGDFVQSGRAADVAGSWTLEIRPTPGGALPPEIKALITFDKGGGCIETVILPPVTPAHGSWERTSRREFVFVIVHHLVDAAGSFVGTVRATSHATFIGRDQFHAVFEGSLFDPAGNVIAPISGTERGTRITLDPL
jgi:hypothetical protein